MTASTFEFASRATRAPRRANRDRRTRLRLRDLCDEVLASYRLAQGQDVVTAEDREIADQVLRDMMPQRAR
jgi:predicted ATP-dependent protease